jgi:predicted acyltransferase
MTMTGDSLAASGAEHAFSSDVPAPVHAAEPREQPAQVDAAPSRPTPRGTMQRLVSLDAYRGLVMVLMVSAGLGIPNVVRNFEQSPALRHLKTPIWDRLAFQTDHTQWVGCSLWDQIQPSFMFMVGAALAFSIASRRNRGQSFARMLTHAIVRSIVLVLLAVLLQSNWTSGTDWTFPNVLAQIGLGYTFLFLIAWLKPRWQLTAAIAILVANWAAFALYPKPPANLELSQVNLPADWPRLHGFAAHWDKNTNLAQAFDHRFLNLFPRIDHKPYEFNAGGYQTLNFIPSLATMIFGLLASGLIRGRLGVASKFGIMLGTGLAGLGLGWVLNHFGICPLVKRIWTPSWAIYSAGWAFVALALFYLVIDVARIRFWAYPLVVVGMNSIAVYCISQLLRPWFRATLHRHFGPHVYDVFGAAYTPMVDASLFLLFAWLICWWMYRKQVFIKI